MEDLHYELPIGLVYDKDKAPVREVELLPVNGVAEKIILKRLPNKPYTWAARLLTICMARIGQKEIAGPARKKYLSTNQIEVNNIVTRLSIADVNSSLLEIHRKLWAPVIENQPYACQHCGHQGEADLSLESVDYTEEQKEMMAGGDLRHLLNFTVALKYPIIFDSPKNNQGEASFPEYDGKPVSAFSFRAPILMDAINNERHITREDTNTVEFWRHIARDCLVGAVITTDAGEEKMSDSAFKILTRADLFTSTLRREDLKAIRDAMYCEKHPSLDFISEVTCHNCGETTAVAVSPTAFFGD